MTAPFEEELEEGARQEAIGGHPEAISDYEEVIRGYQQAIDRWPSAGPQQALRGHGRSSESCTWKRVPR